MEVGRIWAENYYVTKANLMHERVHNPDMTYSQRGKQVFTSVSVYNDCPEYDIYGVTDCIEATVCESGVKVLNSDKRYDLCIVEYKPTMPKRGSYNNEDAMQVFAQKLCVDYVFGCNCEAYIYYGDVKKRIKLPLTEMFSEYDATLKGLLKKMRTDLASGTIPPIRKGQKCSGCSLKDICMPLKKQTACVKDDIKSIEENMQCEDF